MLDQPVVLHKGIYKPTATVAEAIFMITGMTIGAGVLGLPYVVSKVGLLIGLPMILVLGLTMLLLNLIIGDIAVRTKENLQLPGFAGRYLGPWAKGLLSIVMILTGLGSLLAYLVGEGQALSALFGGPPLWWSIFFWSIGSFLVWLGLRAVKRAEKYLSLAVMIIILGLSIFLLTKFQAVNFWHVELANFFLPFGVILFALNAAPAIAEAHALLPGSQRHFRTAIIIGTLVPMVLYLLFALAMVSFSGTGTAEVATLGLSGLGPLVAAAANLFAILAMGACFLGMGTAVKQTLVWDYKISRSVAVLAVTMIPLLLFLFGFKSFVEILDVIGGLFIGIEAVLLTLIAFRARQRGDLDAGRYGLSRFWLAAAPVLVFFSLATLWTVFRMF